MKVGDVVVLTSIASIRAPKCKSLGLITKLSYSKRPFQIAHVLTHHGHMDYVLVEQLEVINDYR